MMFLSKPMLGAQLDHSDSLNNPVLDLLFNEGHGDVVHDLSGWGNHGTLHGFDFPPTAMSGWNPGMDGACLAFDGTDDYISTNMDLWGDISIWMSIYFNGVGGGLFGNMHASYESGDTDTISAILGTDGNITFCIDDGDTITTSSGMSKGQHSIITQHGNFGMKIFVDGVLSANTNTPIDLDTRGEHAYYESGSGNIYILIGDTGYSSINSAYSDPLNGAIARARILPRCMSAFEVMQTQINPYGVYQQ